MGLRLSQRRASALCLLLLFSSAFAVAGEKGETTSGHDSAAWLTLAFSFFNFGLFATLLHRYAWPAVRDFLSSRRREVAEAMAAAEQARAEAEAIRQEYGRKEAALEETRRRLLDDIRQGATADRERVLQEAQVVAQRLRADAERQADHDLARARRELRAEAARLATELAEKEVRTRLSDSDRSRLVREFVEGVTRQ